MTQEYLQDAYAQGFMAKCAEYGVDPEMLIKQSQFAWTPPPEVVGGGSGAAEKWLNGVEEAQERMNARRQARQQAREQAKTAPGTTAVGPKFSVRHWWNTKATQLGDAFTNKATQLGDAFANSAFGRSKFGKNLGWAYVPNAMIRQNRRDNAQIGLRVNKALDPYRGVSDFQLAKLRNQAYHLRTKGHVPSVAR